MNKSRMEAFSDGVIAILITIMVFEIKVPGGSDFVALQSVIPSLSFLYLGIYWNNQHNMLQLTQRINGAVGEPALAVLVVAAAVCHRAAESQSPESVAGGTIRNCPAACWHRLRYSVFEDHRSRR